jgi:hypothetical protein
MRLRDQVRRLKLEVRSELESFELLDGSRYHYDPAEAHKKLFLAACALGVGEVPDPPELYQKLCQAKGPAAVLERLAPENPEKAFVNPAEIYDRDVLVNERRLVPLVGREPEDLSEQ